MKLTFSSSEKMLGLSILMTFTLVALRILYTGELTYGFYYWNTFLAIIPLFISRLLNEVNNLWYKWGLLACWVLFYPNAPYIITDLFHYFNREEFPFWVDLVIVTTGTWNGLLLGMASLMHIEKFFGRHMPKRWVDVAVLICIFLSGYGIYLGRYLRFNSWDFFTAPQTILYTSVQHIMQPAGNMKVWSFTLLFSIMYALFYFTIRNLGENVQSQTKNMKL